LLARGRVGRGRDLSAASVEDGKATPPSRNLAKPSSKRGERAHAAQRQVATQAKRTGGRNADPQARERAGANADRDPLDGAPAAGRSGGSLDLGQQRRGVLRPALLGRSEQSLVEHLAIACSGDGGVGGRGVEADEGQWAGTKK
jgi:hypothetical protein